ncbi:MAG: site-specific integrase, partial [Bacteroidales bacterium]|nr:site-specific integrase [Bacteroidales bacterium]
MNWAPYTKGFKVYLQLEKSLSKNTVEAYLSDVCKLTTFEEENIQRSSPAEIGLADLQLFIKHINEEGLSARTQARIISSLKAFFKYLYLENIIRDDPASLLESPRPGRKLPDTLSVEEVKNLINTIDMSLPEGERNKAIIETLYGCGLRVSELINLKITDI